MRCIKAKRPCGGYEPSTLSPIRQYAPQTTPVFSSYPSTARKCGLPKRIPVPGTDILPQDEIPTEISQIQSNAFALRGFFYDYCVVPSNASLSRGYFAGLEKLAHELGPESNLVKACQAVAFGPHGKLLNRPQLVQKAQRFYQELLGAFATSLSRQTPADQLVPIATLLGIYQIAMVTEDDHGDHEAHANGLAALTGLHPSPTMPPHDGLGRVKAFLQVTNVLSVPALSVHTDRLEDLLILLEALWTEFEFEAPGSPTNHVFLRDRCFKLRQRFLRWQDSRAKESRPVEVGYIEHSQHAVEIEVGCWPGKVDSYLDLYVAGIWNIWRTGQLLLASLILNLSEAIGDSNSLDDVWFDVHEALQGMLSSIPYHLTDNLQTFTTQQSTKPGITEAGKHLGGLLLLHPLYVASKISAVPEAVQTYVGECLLWIRANMGNGQALLLATSSAVDRKYLASACMIIWAGFLG